MKKCFTQRLRLILQNHRGRPPPDQVWVFGMCDTSQCPALGVMCIVPDRPAATLLPIIQRHVRPGTVIHSDEWAAYRRVQQLNSVAQHSVINHSLHFVDTASNTHTQNIEAYWNRVKRIFKRMKGVHSTMLHSYLDVFMWRERHGLYSSCESLPGHQLVLSSVAIDFYIFFAIHLMIFPIANNYLKYSCDLVVISLMILFDS